jgi:hypothetical protein
MDCATAFPTARLHAIAGLPLRGLRVAVKGRYLIAARCNALSIP